MAENITPIHVEDVRHNGRFTLIAFAIALVSFVIAGFCGKQSTITTPKSMGADEFSVLPNKVALQWMSLGYKNFVADLIWIRALQYNNLRNEAHLAEMFADAIIALDPEFEPVYKYASINAVFSEGISVNGVERSNYYLELAFQTLVGYSLDLEGQLVFLNFQEYIFQGYLQIYLLLYQNYT